MIYFAAVSREIIYASFELYHDSFLIPVDQVAPEVLIDMVGKGKRMLIDSGVFQLMIRYKSLTGIPFNRAIHSNLEDIPGWKALYDRYVRFLSEYKEQVWGYIEFDIGDHIQKTRIRRGLEKKGLLPIPVYHPLSDPVSYFLELCEEYPRVAVSNFARSPNVVRLAIAQSIWHLRKKHHLKTWIHYLGMSINNIATICYPPDSCDSASYLNFLKFGGSPEVAGFGSYQYSTIGLLEKGGLYNLQTQDPQHDGRPKAQRVLYRAWRDIINGNDYHFSRLGDFGLTDEIR